MIDQRKIQLLRQYRPEEWEIARLEEELQRWESRGERVTTMFSDAPGKGRGDRVQDTVDAMDVLQQQLLDRLGEIAIRRAKLERAVGAVIDPLLRELLRCRYFDGLTWEQVGERIGYGSRQVFRLHEKALEAIQFPETDE